MQSNLESSDGSSELHGCMLGKKGYYCIFAEYPRVGVGMAPEAGDEDRAGQSPSYKCGATPADSVPQFIHSIPNTPLWARIHHTLLLHEIAKRFGRVHGKFCIPNKLDSVCHFLRLRPEASRIFH